MAMFDWSALPTSVTRELARHLGLPSAQPAQELAAAYPDGPDPEFIRLTWPVLRDRWVARSPDVRARVVAALRARGLGDLEIGGTSAAAQRDYLHSCRNSAGLRAAVAGALRPPSERDPRPVPSTAGAAGAATAGAAGEGTAGAAGAATADAAGERTAGAAGAGAPPPIALGLDAKVASAWAQFRACLVDVLRLGADADHVLIELDPQADGSDESTGYYVRWQVDRGAGVFNAQAVSNHVLPPSRRLTAAQLSGLVELGWEVPAPADGAPDFHATVAATEPERLADLLLRTLREVFGTPHPAFLTAAGGNGEDPIDIAALQLRHTRSHEPGGEAVEAQQDLEEVVRFTLARGLGLDVDQLRRDDDGDYPIRAGSAMVFVRVFPAHGVVSVFSPVLVDATATDALRRRLIDLQQSIPFVKFVIEDDVVSAVVHVMGNPLHPDHLDRAVLLMTTMCDQLDDELQGDFGGRTFFGPPSGRPSSDDAPIGGYL